MGRNIPQTGAPIAEQTVDQLADEDGYNSEEIRECLDGVSELMTEGISHYREHRVVAETDELLVVLSEFHLRNETDELAEWGIDVSDDLAEDLAHIVSKAYHAAFKSANLRSITGFSSQEATNALSADYPRIIRKPEQGDDVEYRIQYEHGRVAPYNFVARANATVDGEYGTLRIERTYRACPDDNSDEDRNVIRVTSEATHVESDTLVADAIDEFAVDKQFRMTDAFGHPRRLTPEDDELRQWVYDNHTADFEAEYEAIARTLQICDECGAYPSEHVYVEQRLTHQLDPSVPDTLCNHCYARLLEEMTTLSRQEAEVYALKESSLSHRQVAVALGLPSKSQTGTVMGRVRDKVNESSRTADLVRVE